MVDLFTVAVGLAAGLLLVGTVLYVTLYEQIEWDTEAKSEDQFGELGTEKP
ncbi:MAG: hypothetical protein V5A27_03750 [Halapricum sp.]